MEALHHLHDAQLQEQLHGLAEGARGQLRAEAEVHARVHAAVAAAVLRGEQGAQEQVQHVHKALHPADHLQQEHAGGEPDGEGEAGEAGEGGDTKRCAACRVTKPVGEFYRDRTHSRGIKTRCKDCLRACKEAFKNQQRAKSAAEQVTVTQKKCSHCGQEKPATDFSRSSYQRTGLRSWCKECSSRSKKQAKAEGRWKSYDARAKQPRKCRTCGEQRPPDDFPVDPATGAKRLRECTFCLQASVQGALPVTRAAAQQQAGAAAMGAWAPHISEYWQHSADAARTGGDAYRGGGAGGGASESLARILQAAMAGGGLEEARVLPEMLGQLGAYTDPGDPFSELPPDAQAAVIQQFVDQQHRAAAAPLLHGYAQEALYPQEAFAAYGAEPHARAQAEEGERAGGHPHAPQHFAAADAWTPHLHAHLARPLAAAHHAAPGWPSAFVPPHRRLAVEPPPECRPLAQERE